MSFDKPWKNKAFKNAEGFQYALWSDQGRELAQYYGAASSAKQPYADRMTVILDPTGQWVLEYPPAAVNFNLLNHVDHVLSDLHLLIGK